MKLLLILLSSIFGTTLALPVKYFDSLDVLGNGLGVPCSTNSSAAWVDLVLIIDVSSNMGMARIQQIQQKFQQIFSKYSIGQDKLHNTRVALITYATSATTLADFSYFKNYNDLVNGLNSIMTINGDRNSNLNTGLDSAYTLIQGQIASNYQGKPIGVVLLAAGVNTAYLNDISQAATNIRQYGTIISVNYNSADITLGNILNGISTSPMVFYSSSNTLSYDLDWAFMQTNCYCPRSYGMQFSAYDPQSNRVTRFAECYIILNWSSFPPNMNSLTMCSPNYQVSITNQAKNDFVQNSIGLAQFGVDSVYISLHRNNAQTWVWYDYDGSEILLGNYTNWEPNVNPSTTDNCVVAEKSSSGTYPWKPVSCFPAQTGVTHTVCAKLACDANRKSCISGINDKSFKHDGNFTVIYK
uniref:Uncharacterized protein n=1 Tax=Acrobeloides nanus TaxID=290746 RepID=A0A914C8X4_9BILA